jgi:catechol 2,3-dioxygenase-like lactoylglutathione lyase family enzyme
MNPRLLSAAPAVKTYDVGGVLLERPFKIRRLGHFGFNVEHLDEAAHFYVDLLGFMISDEARNGGLFTRYGSDHHAFVLFPRRQESSGEVTINQITWQVGSLREVGDAVDFFADQGVQVGRVGRDTPGSNWHVYPLDPDGHTNELYYGIEQVGWDGYSKPRSMYNRGFRERPPLPQMAEMDEVQQAVDSGVALNSGYRHTPHLERTFDVDGILLERPFKVVKIGPVRLFVTDVERSADYYSRILGLTVTSEMDYHGHHCVFLRTTTEHHTMALYPRALRSRLGLSEHTTCLSFGLQLASYRQLRDAVSFLRHRGVVVRDLPPELSPGIDYSAFAIDSDGHAVQLHYYMQQVGGAPAAWQPADGTASFASWPETVGARPDTFGGEPFLGPWG